jgi:hypothetical protein
MDDHVSAIAKVLSNSGSSVLKYTGKFQHHMAQRIWDLKISSLLPVYPLCPTVPTPDTYFFGPAKHL